MDVQSIITNPKFWAYVAGGLVAGGVAAAWVHHETHESEEHKKVQWPEHSLPRSVSAFVWLVILLAISYVAFAAASAANDTDRMIINVLFAVFLILLLVLVYMFYHSCHYKGAMIVAVLMLLVSIALTWYAFKTGGMLGWYAIPVALWMLYQSWLLWKVSCLNDHDSDDHHHGGHHDKKHKKHGKDSDSSDSD